MSRLDQPFLQIDPGDRALIDAEHARLEQFMLDLRDTCENFNKHGDCFQCTRAQVATCQGRVTSFFYDFMDLIAEHVENEEAIMRRMLIDADNDAHFRAHQVEHARLLRDVRELMRKASVHATQGNPSASIRLLFIKIAEMFGEHARQYDGEFLGHMHH